MALTLQQAFDIIEKPQPTNDPAAMERQDIARLISVVLQGGRLSNTEMRELAGAYLEGSSLVSRAIVDRARRQSATTSPGRRPSARGLASPQPPQTGRQDGLLQDTREAILRPAPPQAAAQAPPRPPRSTSDHEPAALARLRWLHHLRSLRLSHRGTSGQIMNQHLGPQGAPPPSLPPPAPPMIGLRGLRSGTSGHLLLRRSTTQCFAARPPGTSAASSDDFSPTQTLMAPPPGKDDFYDRLSESFGGRGVMFNRALAANPYYRGVNPWARGVLENQGDPLSCHLCSVWQ